MTVVCRMCGFAGEGELLRTFVVAVTGSEEHAVRCPECGTVALLDDIQPSSTNDDQIDQYLENDAGIGTIAGLIDALGPARGRRMLDVGCGYGFGLDYARTRYGWEGVGVEPSHAAVRGRAELGLDIRQEYFDDGTDLGDFDLIFSSEVLEHVPDPAAFLIAARDRLRPGGVVVLTTPDAEVYDGDRPESEVWSAISAGYHFFNASRPAVERLLRELGFGAVRTARRGVSMAIAAAVDPATVLPDIDRAHHDAATAAYYRDRLADAPRGSALAIGFATRALRSAVAVGDWDGARRLVNPTRRAFRRRHRVDPRVPRSVLRHLVSDQLLAAGLVNACFSLGMLDLHDRRMRRSAELFDAAAAAARRRIGAVATSDMQTVDLLWQSTYHAALALVDVDAVEAVRRTIDELPDALDSSGNGAEAELAERRSRIFVGVVGGGALTEAAVLAPTVAGHLDVLLADPRRAGVVTARDTLYSLGTLAAQTGDAVAARRWLDACRARCLPATADDHAAALLPAIDAALASLGEDLGSPAEATDAVAAPPDGFSHLLDVFWSDAEGTFVAGWLHLTGSPGTGLTLRRAEGDPVVASRHRRADLQPFWPDAPDVAGSGFRAYLAGAVSGPLVAAFEVDGLAHSVAIPVPSTTLPMSELPTPSDENALARALLADAPEGPVLELGARTSGEAGEPIDFTARALLPGRKVVGYDIHAGPSVDLVGDAHRLSDVVAPGEYPVVVSASLLEHVTAPWLVAAAIARILPIGGITVHAVPWLWPSHSQPNDFWRASEAGLRRLFGADLGFEVLGSGSMGGARVVPTAAWRELNPTMATHVSPTMCWVVARKIDDRADRVEWPYDADAGVAAAREYPVDAVRRSEWDETT